jgi:glycerol-3-phosphate dehydrogenase
MSAITRDFAQASNKRIDVIIVGGGIYGSMLMLEAVRAGLKPLLLEKSDFGGGTSFNNLRIVHGGLRYLQTLNFGRIRESVAERRWFLHTFPDLIRPLPCLMPLYGGLTKNRLTMAAALGLNDWLTRRRNDGIDQQQHLPDCELLSAAETLVIFPKARRTGLKGGALWHDAVMPNCQRVLLEVLHWATAGGGIALNYAEVSGLILDGSQVRGVRVTDCLSRQTHEFLADIVINATGPDCRAFVAQYAADMPELFRPSHAWNLLLDRPPLADGAVAVHAPHAGSRVFFAHSLGGRLLVGTGHAGIATGRDEQLDRTHIDAMLGELNDAVPDLDVHGGDILRIFAGQLPVTRPGSVDLSDRPMILVHRESGGPAGLVSVSGVKYTTSRSTAAAAISRITGGQEAAEQSGYGSLPARPAPLAYQLHPRDCPQRDERIARMRTLIREEAAATLSDVLLRRSNLAADPQVASELAVECCEAFGWSPAEHGDKIERLLKELTPKA